MLQHVKKINKSKGGRRGLHTDMEPWPMKKNPFGGSDTVFAADGNK